MPSPTATTGQRPRGKVLWHTAMSLDGFIAGPDDAMDWVFDYAGPNPAVEEVIRTTGAVLAGRRSYDVGRKARRPEMRQVFGGGWSGPQFVLTHRPAEPDPDNAFLSGDIRVAVREALEAAGGRNLLLIGKEDRITLDCARALPQLAGAPERPCGRSPGRELT